MFFTLLIVSSLPFCQTKTLRDLNVKIVGSVYDYFDENFEDVQQEEVTTTTASTTTSSTTASPVFVPDLPKIILQPPSTPATPAPPSAPSPSPTPSPSPSTPSSMPTPEKPSEEHPVVRIFHGSSVRNIEKEEAEKKKQASGREFVRSISVAIEEFRKNLTDSFDWIKSNVAANGKQWEEIKKLSNHVNEINKRLPSIENSFSDVGLLRTDVRKLSQSVDWLRENAETGTGVDEKPESFFSR